MEANEMEAGSRNQGGQALEEFQGRHDDMRGAIAVRGFEFEHDLPFGCASQPLVAQGGTGDVAAEALNCLQDGEEEHLHPILDGEIGCKAYAY